MFVWFAKSGGPAPTFGALPALEILEFWQGRPVAKHSVVQLVSKCLSCASVCWFRVWLGALICG